ncbi:helix-turn-helix domain-containing protein [Streptomyces sp. ML-6]|uniref:TetR/AcrR family transcriptional regulator n=1 Tax=Streptomyces sp. ML-6 TaxID=2982693 RepID=UPI0024C076E9|nr:helix-turn-helix domain-containing protein [Streptomyces sp. ML-6]MDK0523514.1 TetR/AcrR family transcriptional regulator [Streptomyces sp. ML-6]
MGRPRAFDETAVLDAAAGEFRAHDFDGTSTEQPCEAAGVRCSSLYNAFESKDALFERALGRCMEVVRERQAAISYAGGMRYPDGGRLSAERRRRREGVRMRAIALFDEDVEIPCAARELRVSGEVGLPVAPRLEDGWARGAAFQRPLRLWARPAPAGRARDGA